MNDSRSRIRYSVRSSDRLWLACERLEHQHVIERRPTAFRSVCARHRPLQIRPRQFEIDHHAQPLQAVAFGRERLQPLVNVEKTRLPPHLRPPAQTPLIESRTRQNYEVFGISTWKGVKGPNVADRMVGRQIGTIT